MTQFDHQPILKPQKKRMTLRRWLYEQGPHTESLLREFDRECEEITREANQPPVDADLRAVKGDLCPTCKGEGTWNDACAGDISYNEYSCKVCSGKGGSGLVGEILHYLKRKSMGHNEVDAPALADLALSFFPLNEVDLRSIHTAICEKAEASYGKDMMRKTVFSIGADVAIALLRPYIRPATKVVPKQGLSLAYLKSFKDEPGVKEAVYNPADPERYRSEKARQAALQGTGGTFQQRVAPWMQQCFGPVISADTEERNHRFLEEALELVQACGCTAENAHKLVDYVYGRPVGEKVQESGGVMVTHAALCLAQGIDMHESGEIELARIMQPEVIQKIRIKQANKPGNRSPLPETPACKPTDSR